MAVNPQPQRTKSGQRNLAIPLCLPNNWKWDPVKGKCEKTMDTRSSLYVVEEALECLRTIEGPVCVVSIAGTYRQGKSYVLSEAFHQPEVFPLGHHFDPETMGIWLWVVPKKYKDSNGRKFTVVLLDSEGIDSASGKGLDDHQIFTLTVLLASVLIYNSKGVPTRSDVEKLDFIVKLSKRIQIRPNSRPACGEGDSELFHKTFPYFIWLLRDVTQSIPRDCTNIKDYFLKQVFKDQESSNTGGHDSKRVAESILHFFPGFDAFMLPTPTVDPELMKCLSEKRSQINPLFVSGLNEFKGLLKDILAPKRSYNDGEFVTGKGLAALVQLYVEAINTPGVIPNVQGAWNIFVETKCSEAKQDALRMYDVLLTSHFSDKLPCDNNEIRLIHNTALQHCEVQFMAEVVGISTDTVEMHITDLKTIMSEKLNSLQADNEKQTRDYCKGLLNIFKTVHLDPVLHQLQGNEAAKVSYEDIIRGYNRIKEEYEESAKGAKNVIAAVFQEFHPEFLKEKEQYLGLLRQLKDFDEDLTRELAAKAYLERERKRLEEQQSRLQQANLEQKKQMEMLIQNLDEEKKRLSEQLEGERKAQRDQIDNMMEANMKQAQEGRKAFIQERRALRDCLKAMQECNEENMKKIRDLSDLAERQKSEKENLLEQMKVKAEEDREAFVKELNDRHDKEMKALRDEMDAKLDDVIKNAPPVAKEEFRTPDLINQRTKAADDLNKKIGQTHKDRQSVEEPGVLKKVLDFVSVAVPAAGLAVSAICPPVAPIVTPITAVVGAAAGFVAKICKCSIM